jgi:hypothetical protein
VARFVCERDDRNVILKSMSKKKARSLSEKWRFMTKKRRCSDWRWSVRSQRACQPHPPAEARGFRLAAVAEKLAGSVADRLRHWASCAGNRLISMTSADETRAAWIV